jgi:hypothetical protein
MRDLKHLLLVSVFLLNYAVPEYSPAAVAEKRVHCPARLNKLFINWHYTVSHNKLF